MRTEITVFWRGDVCIVQAFAKTSVVVGDALDADVALPCPRTVIDSFGEHVVGDWRVRFEESAPVWFGRRRVRLPMRSMLVSTALHAAVLALAFFLALRADPKQQEADRIDRLRDYIGRLSEQPHDPLAHVDVVATLAEERDDRAGAVGEGASIQARDVAVANHAQERRASVKPHAAASHGGGSGGATGGSSCAAFANAAHDPKSTWIEFVLNDSDGRPVAGEPYRVTLPDGTVRSGKTDRRGLVCFTGVAPGNAHIEWPRLGNAAQYVGANDKAI